MGEGAPSRWEPGGDVGADLALAGNLDGASMVTGDLDGDFDGEPAVTGGRWRPRRSGVGSRTGPEELLGTQVEDQAVGGRHRATPPEEGRGPPLLSVPGSLRGALVRVSPAAVLGMVLVVLLAAVVFGWRVWASERAAAPEPVAPVTSGSATSEAAGVTAAPAAGRPEDAPDDEAPASAPTVLVVHVAGAVRAPGVVELAPGARVRDAVQAAEGLTGQADTARINLARPVADGERIWVPVPGEEEPELPVGSVPPDPGGGGSPGGATSPEGSDGSVPVVDLNSADQTALETLPGVGPVTAGRILAWREEHGSFSSAEELLEVSGIGERTLEQLRPHVSW